MKTAEDAKDAEGTKLDEITGAVVDAAMKVHTALGPGLLESVYEKCLKHELTKRGLRVESQLWLPVSYDGILSKADTRLIYSWKGKWWWN